MRSSKNHVRSLEYLYRILDETHGDAYASRDELVRLRDSAPAPNQSDAARRVWILAHTLPLVLMFPKSDECLRPRANAPPMDSRCSHVVYRVNVTDDSIYVLSQFSNVDFTRRDMLERFHPTHAFSTMTEHALGTAACAKQTLAIEGVTFYPTAVDQAKRTIKFEAAGLVLDVEEASDAQARAAQIFQCQESLKRINQDLDRVLASDSNSTQPVAKAAPVEESLECATEEASVDKIELEDVGRWYIEQRILQAKIAALTNETPIKTTLVKPGPSFMCPLNAWTLIAGGTWVFVVA
jgi:hypothetical protein